MTPEDIASQRMTALEIKASFAEDLLDELNRVVIRQQQQIDALVRELTQLREQQQQSGVAGNAARLTDDLPPHY
jgi:SlyX protein